MPLLQGKRPNTGLYIVGVIVVVVVLLVVLELLGALNLIPNFGAA